MVSDVFLVEPYKMRVPSCALFPWRAIFSPGNVELDIPVVVGIHYNNPAKVLLMLLHYGTILHSGLDSMQI